MNDTLRLERLALHIEGAFLEIARTRMAGLPFVNAQLGVAMRGLQRIAQADVGVLVTPWFMNLIMLPADQSERRKVGTKSRRLLPAGSFEVVWSHEETVGGYWSASLFSPMNEFADMDTAIATADEALKVIFTRPDEADGEEIREALVNPGDGRDVDQRLADAEAEARKAAEARAEAEADTEAGAQIAATEQGVSSVPAKTKPTPQKAGLNRRALFGMRRRPDERSETELAQ